MIASRKLSLEDMASIPCSKTGCLYTTGDQVDKETPLTDKLVLLSIHADVEHSNGPSQGNNGASSSVKAEMDPPKLHAGSDLQAWDQFIARWTIFKSSMIRGLNDPEIVSELLGDSKVDMSLKEVVEFVARKEQAKTERGTVSVEQ